MPGAYSQSRMTQHYTACQQGDSWISFHRHFQREFKKANDKRRTIIVAERLEIPRDPPGPPKNPRLKKGEFASQKRSTKPVCNLKAIIKRYPRWDHLCLDIGFSEYRKMQRPISTELSQYQLLGSILVRLSDANIVFAFYLKIFRVNGM